MAEKISLPELYKVRLLIEPEMARLAAARITPEYARRLREALEGEEEPIQTLEEERGAENGHPFHSGRDVREPIF